MASYLQKRILIIYTGGTIAGKVAKSNVSTNVKNEPESFMAVLNDSMGVVKRNWNIEIHPKIKELFNLDSSNIQPENWTTIISEIEEQYDEFDAFIILHGTSL